jgi:hypothetical protein
MKGIKLVASTLGGCTTQCMLLSKQKDTLQLGSGEASFLDTSLRSYGTISIDRPRNHYAVHM